MLEEHDYCLESEVLFDERRTWLEILLCFAGVFIGLSDMFYFYSILRITSNLIVYWTKRWVILVSKGAIAAAQQIFCSRNPLSNDV